MVWVLALGMVTMTPLGVAQEATQADELPEGEGKKILLASCTACHELQEVTKFRGYFTREQWRDIVVTMVEYGAPVERKQIDVLTDYLTLHFGRQ